MHGRLKPLNDLTRRHSSGKNRPGAVHGSSQPSVTNTSNISAQARQFRPRRVHKLGLMQSYYAHTREGRTRDTWDPLVEHLEKTAARCAVFSRAFAPEAGRMVGLWH